MLVEANDDQRREMLRQLETRTTWSTVTADSTENAINVLNRQPVDVMILGGMDATDERKLRRIAAIQQPGMLIVGQTTEWFRETDHAIALLETDQRPEIRFMDDALKHAGIPVVIQ